MHRALILLPLTLWITAIQAFFPYLPNYLKVAAGPTAKRTSSDDGAARNLGFVSFKITAKASNVSCADATNRTSGLTCIHRMMKLSQPRSLE